MYSGAELRFHIVSDDKTRPIISDIMNRINQTSNCIFTYKYYNMFKFQKYINNILLHKLKIEEDNLMEYLSPLVLPFLLKNTNYIIYMKTSMVFQANIVDLYNFIKEKDALFAVAYEQTDKYQNSFEIYNNQQPTSRVKNFTGFNTDVLLMNSKLIRMSEDFLESIKKERLINLVNKYFYQYGGKFLQLSEYFNLIYIEFWSWIQVLPCEWNKLDSKKVTHKCKPRGKIINHNEKDFTEAWQLYN